MHQAIDPVGEAHNDFAIFRDLARRLGCEDAFAEGRDETAWLRHLYDAYRDSGCRVSEIVDCSTLDRARIPFCKNHTQKKPH
jgi:biotin/methionine sulfoxide reductase